MRFRTTYPLGERLASAAATLRELRGRRGAGTWVPDNYQYLQAALRDVRDAVPRGYWRRLPLLDDGDARVYRMARQFVQSTGASFDIETAVRWWREQQREAPLSLAELWAIAPMLKLALVETVCASENETAAAAAIRTLRRLESAPWRGFVESLSAVERILRQDPAGVYAHMDFDTRDSYRHAVEKLARATRKSEVEIATRAVELAREEDAHVGLFLIEQGAARISRRATIPDALRRLVLRFPNFFYLGALAVITAVVVCAVLRIFAPLPWWAAALVLLPASQAALAVVNPLVNLLIPPRRLPRLDFSDGIPSDCRTFVVVPTLLLSRAGVERLLGNLEIHYLANRDPNLLFALLTDFPDSPTPESPHADLLELCAEGIRRLNERHAADTHAPFYLFHRAPEWNPSEGVWMGRERKRGKLADFNLYLLGKANSFDTIEGDAELIGDVRYVLTLDSDTQLPRDTAGKLVATMAHPLNRPVFDQRTGIVRRGYALIQPRISISMESAGRSHLARIFSGQTGFDPYTTAVSDVYQDLHGRASFTGKGIYDLRAFYRATVGRFPANALLSHDLIEGEFVRTGLATDLEFIDDYPSSYEAYSKRKHRWVRGDWQVGMWLLPRVPDSEWRWVRNPLPLVSRWKIFDNLRRSLVEISLLALLVAGWCVLPGGPVTWTLAALALLASPAYSELAVAALRVPPPRFWRAWGRDVAWRFGQAHFEALFHLVFLAHQSCAMADAVVRTLVRRLFTSRRLLEWESAAQAEASAGKSRSLTSVYLYASPALAGAAALAVHLARVDGRVAAVVLELWIFAPLAARLVNRALPAKRDISTQNCAFLRDLALQTWRFFADLCRAEDNWLIPDNLQEDPPRETHTISPTNLGLLIASNVSAHDFGYLTAQETAARTGRTLRTMAQMPRCRGHFYNWYHTRTLLPILPHYVSSVDSGNLAASLVVLKQACLEMLRRQIIGWQALEGLRDHGLRLVNALPPDERTGGVVKLAAALEQQLDYRPTDLFYWEGVLSEAAKVAERLCEHAGRSCERLAKRRAPEAEEVCYWSQALASRMEAVTRDLYALAPWLAAPFEMELRMRSGDPALKDLFAELCKVPVLGELETHYDAVAKKIRALLASPQPLYPSFRQSLEQLLEALRVARRRGAELANALEEHAAVAAGFIAEMDFGFLFDRDRKLLRIGYDAGSGRPDEAYYDLLASEARTAVFLAIAKSDLPRDAWFRLGRKLTAWRGHRTLLSWSGTMFEYLMPELFMQTHANTLLGQSLRAVVEIQRAYGRERNVPWGISESAHGARDGAMRYQYYAFGVPAVSLKRQTAEDLVTAPYASALALMVDSNTAADNLRRMAEAGSRGRYGMYEAVDHSVGGGRTVVRCFMAHHQAMTLLSLANVLLDGAVRRRFHAEPMVQATEYLLAERLPALLEIAAEEEPSAAPAAAFQAASPLPET